MDYCSAYIPHVPHPLPSHAPEAEQLKNALCNLGFRKGIRFSFEWADAFK